MPPTVFAECLDPEIPNLPDDQLKALHDFKDKLLTLYDNIIEKVDKKVVLALVMVHAAKFNADLFPANSPQLKAYPTTDKLTLDTSTAQSLFHLAIENAARQIKYKPPKQPAASAAEGASEKTGTSSTLTINANGTTISVDPSGKVTINSAKSIATAS